MVNTTEFTNRIKQILQHHDLTASQFADRIGVQRSSISHILSGRNKPSLDFVIKVTTEFKDVDMYWLLNGKGSFPKVVKSLTPSQTSSSNPIQITSTSSNKSINRIVVFYNDGTFEEFNKS